MDETPDLRQKIVVAGIVPYRLGNTSKYLLVRSEDGLWGWPGGTVELHENILTSLSREIKEETGVEVVPVSIVDLGFLRSPSGHHLFRIVYGAKYVECEIASGIL